MLPVTFFKIVKQDFIKLKKYQYRTGTGINVGPNQPNKCWSENTPLCKFMKRTLIQDICFGGPVTLRCFFILTED
jgi:hypothetical protein